MQDFFPILYPYGVPSTTHWAALGWGLRTAGRHRGRGECVKEPLSPMGCRPTGSKANAPGDEPRGGTEGIHTWSGCTAGGAPAVHACYAQGMGAETVGDDSAVRRRWKSGGATALIRLGVRDASMSAIRDRHCRRTAGPCASVCRPSSTRAWARTRPAGLPKPDAQGRTCSTNSCPV